jgi:hypothetical protein
VLAAALFAHESAAFGVHVPAGLDVDLLLLWLAGRLAARRAVVSLAARGGCAGVASGWMVAGVAGFAEQVGERGDGFEQQGVDAVLLVGGAVGAELGDGAAVLGLGGELA